VSRWRLITAIVAAFALALVIATCSGDDDEGDGNRPADPPAAEAPSGGGGAPQPDPGQLPPKFTRCMAKRGFAIKALDDIHAAPPQVLQACFGALHE
jgi:hypothetical protein